MREITIPATRILHTLTNYHQCLSGFLILRLVSKIFHTSQQRRRLRLIPDQKANEHTTPILSEQKD
jgi:hypothetical protein